MPFQPNKPIVASRKSDPDAVALVPIIGMSDSETTRHERNLGGLPRLEDDPGWSPPTFEFAFPVWDDTPPRWFHRFLRRRTGTTST